MMPNRIPPEMRLDLSEAELEDLAMVSALPWERGKQMLQLPDDLRGWVVLDLGGGASEMTSGLLEKGADAYSIDPKYQRKNAMLEDMRKQVHTAPNMQIRMMINQSLKRFAASSKAHPERYKAASVTQIPFADGFFDFVFSIDTVTAFLDRNREVFLKSIHECLRVTKPGGIIKFTPFQDRQPAWTDEVNALRMANNAEMLAWLKNHPRVGQVEVTDTGVKHHHLLTVETK